MSIRRLTASATLSLVLALTVAGTAAAHECIISSRSAQGNQQAGTHSTAWTILPLSVVYTVLLPAETGQPALQGNQLSWALAETQNQGIPLSFTVRTDKTIGEGSNNPNLANGKGLDHAIDLYGNAIGSIYFQALGVTP